MSFTSFRVAPLNNKLEQNVWRRSWYLKSFIPSIQHAFTPAVLNPFIGLPSIRQKTNCDPFEEIFFLCRTNAWCCLHSLSACFVLGIKGTVLRTPFFVRKKLMSPVPRCSKSISVHFNDNASCLQVPCSAPRKMREVKYRAPCSCRQALTKSSIWLGNKNLVLAGIVNGLVLPNTKVLLITIVPEEFRGRAVGVLTMGFYFG